MQIVDFDTLNFSATAFAQLHLYRLPIFEGLFALSVEVGSGYLNRLSSYKFSLLSPNLANHSDTRVRNRLLSL